MMRRWRAWLAGSERLARVRPRFQLTDLDYRPVAGARVRLYWAPVLSAELVTDGDGRAEMVVQGRVEQRRVKRPTNFVSSLLRLPERVESAVAGAELSYAERRWLYTAEVFRFRDGDCMLGECAVYSGKEGSLAKAERVGLDWRMADMDGLLLTNAGHEPWQFCLQPEGDGWRMDLGLKRYPAPVRR